MINRPGPQLPELSEITRVSHELGADPSLVLHGGGNTSIKGTLLDVTGELIDIVWVKGSGANLATIGPAGFVPLRRARLLALLDVESLDDARMVNELRQASLDASAPTASIESLLHAYLPGRVVLHSHADAIVALTNQPHGAAHATEVLGTNVAVLPYIKPGFALARAVANISNLESVDALVLANHGLFTFGEDADTTLERHLEVVSLASQTVGAPRWGDEGNSGSRGGDTHVLARLRTDLSQAAGRPMFVAQSTSSRAHKFACREGLEEITARGTATPEHLIHTKRRPMIGRDLEGYIQRYRAYVETHRSMTVDLTEIDPAPRVVLDPEWGLLSVAGTVAGTGVVHDIALHTMDIVEAADSDGGYESLDEADSFAMEYWELEQVKLRQFGSAPEFAGEVAVVTGAASGIGLACAEALLAQGAAVIGVDRNPRVEQVSSAPGWRGLVGDVSSEIVMARAAEIAVRDFGGLDVLIVCAGIFPPSASLAEMDDDTWQEAFLVNAAAVSVAFRVAHPFLALAPRGGRVVLVSTKNVAAPGPGVAAYSASKAAAAQTARVAALEWAPDRIRVNQVEPDAVFDTSIWTPELLDARAESYGLSTQEYKTRNLLGIEVTSSMVAAAVVWLCGSGLPATTGAHLSVDGGNERIV